MKVSICNVCCDLMNEIKKVVKDGYFEDVGKCKEDEVESLIKKYVGRVDELVKNKEEDIFII